MNTFQLIQTFSVKKFNWDTTEIKIDEEDDLYSYIVNIFFILKDDTISEIFET